MIELERETPALHPSVVQQLYMTPVPAITVLDSVQELVGVEPRFT
jgi:hypothetical protein